MLMRRFVQSRLRNARPRAGDRILSGSTSRSSCWWRSTVYGVVGYRILEGWRLLDALYMTVIILATVGFHEVHPLGPKRQVFCSGFALSPVGTLSRGGLERPEVGDELADVLGVLGPRPCLRSWTSARGRRPRQTG
jgi:Ion channel